MLWAIRQWNYTQLLISVFVFVISFTRKIHLTFVLGPKMSFNLQCVKYMDVSSLETQIVPLQPPHISSSTIQFLFFSFHFPLNFTSSQSFICRWYPFSSSISFFLLWSIPLPTPRCWWFSWRTTLSSRCH